MSEPINAGDPFTADDAFERWWRAFYGEPEDYADPEDYWVRKAFAWWGWEACPGA